MHDAVLGHHATMVTVLIFFITEAVGVSSSINSTYFSCRKIHHHAAKEGKNEVWCRRLLPNPTEQDQPSQEIDKPFPNNKTRATLNHLMTTCFCTHKRPGKCFPAVWFKSATLPDIKPVIMKRFIYVSVKGPSDWFFEELVTVPPYPGNTEATEEEMVFRSTGG